MLSYISVSNFAIIENIEVTFKNGMTSLTGETGAGKSLLIDAIGLLLGDRATSNIVRVGAEKAVVEGIFIYQNDTIDAYLDELEIDHSFNELHIMRQITQSNNNIIKINNKVVTLRDLRFITNKLADIHTQQDTTRLINPETYLEIIDGFNKEEIEKQLVIYQNALTSYKSELKEYKRLLSSSNTLNEKLDLYQYQKKELESFQLSLEEENQLEQEIDAMKNFDYIFRTLTNSIDMIEQVNAIDVIYDASKGIQNVVEFHTDYKEIKDRMESAYYELDDAFVNLKDLRDSLDFNPMVLEENETRLNSLKTLQRKYRKTVPELIDYLEEITRDLNNIEHYDDVIEQQLTKTKNCFQRLCNEAIILTDMRKKTAAYIEKELLKILKDLELPNTIFQVQFEDTNFTNELDSSIFFENGADKVEFMLSTNIGEPLKPLSSSASGGEMSRIMLGFKNLLAKSLGLSLMIFDEIDTGVSGYVANQVAKNMLEISKTTQVLCITHIPQVASISEHHLRLYKQVSNGRTTSHIVSLSGDERIEEIAKMISGDIVTEAGKSTAKELLSK